MTKGPESKGTTRKLSLKEKSISGLSWFVRAAIIALALSGCNKDDNNNPDGGTGTDPVVDCSNTEYEFGTFLAEKCFCPGDGDQVLEVNDTDNLLNGIKARFKEGTFDECAIAVIANANFVLGGDAITEDDDGVVVDSNNPGGKILSKDGIEYKAISAKDPYNLESQTGFNELQPNKEVSFEFPLWYGTVMKWMPDDKNFASVKPTVLDAEGAKYETDSFSAYAVQNTPFNSFTTNFASGDTNGYDVNDDGVLVQIDMEDEGQTTFPTWVQLEVNDGTDTYALIPVDGEPGKYRLPIFEGAHNLTFRVTDNNTSVAYTHSAEEVKDVDLDEDLCEGVDYDDGDACNGLETCDPSDGSMIPGEDVICEDSNVCTTDTCIPADGSCDYDPLPNVGDTCDDSDAYTVDDECQTDGSCEGTEVDCLTSADCTDTDLCNGDETCNLTSHTCEDGTPIDHDDGDACNGVETCDPTDGSMIPGTDVVCDDTNVCTTDTCIPADGSCDYDPLPNVGDTCDDLDADTNNDVCQSDGSCEGYSFEDSCDDNDGVIDGSACWVLANPLENCDTACDVLDSVANSIDGSCASGEWDDQDGSKCNALTGGAVGYTGGVGFAPFYHEGLDRCYQRSDAYVYTLPDTVCNAIPDTGTKRTCKCEE